MSWGGRSRILPFTPLYRLMAAYVYYTTLFLVLLFDVFIFRLRVIGRGHLARIPKRGAFLVSNHSLYFDPGGGARGWLVHFFPERDLKHQNRVLQPFHPGVFFLAQLFGVPVVPVTLATRHPRLLGRRVARAYVRVTAG